MPKTDDAIEHVVQDNGEDQRQPLAATRKALEEAQLRVRDREVENRALRLRVAELEQMIVLSDQQKGELRTALHDVLSSRSFRLVGSLSTAGKLMGRDIGLSRVNLHRVLNDTL